MTVEARVPHQVVESEDAKGTAAVRKTTRKPGTRKTASRFRKYAGGDESTELVAAAEAHDFEADDRAGGGITAALANLAAADGHTIEQIPVARTVSHPYNDPHRSRPQPGNAKWDELVNSVRVNGILVPALVVTRKAFVAARPHLSEEIDREADYVIVYGHRRRAAAAAAELATMPAVVDDEVMSDQGDLDAMTLENLGREDLSEIAEARMFARYSELGMGQRKIAEKLGIDQATVSRRLSMLLLVPDIQRAVEDGKLRAVEGAVLAGALPYGPSRSWQRSADPDQDSLQRQQEQLAAYELIVKGVNPTRAAERVVTERQSRQRASKEGIEIIDPRKQFGDNFRRHLVADQDVAEAGELFAAIDPGQGTLVYYTTKVPVTESGEGIAPATAGRNDAKARGAAAKARRDACVRLVAAAPPREKLLALMADQYVNGIAAQANSPEGWNLAQRCSKEAGIVTGRDTVAEYRAAAESETDLKRRLEIAWACAVAGFEINAADKTRDWNSIDSTYLELLVERAGYELSPWERNRLSPISQVSYDGS